MICKPFGSDLQGRTLFVDEVHVEVVSGDLLVPYVVLALVRSNQSELNLIFDSWTERRRLACACEDLLIQPYALVAGVEVYELLLLVVSAAVLHSIDLCSGI